MIFNGDITVIPKIINKSPFILKGLDYCYDSDIKMARAGGLEPPTPRFGVLCSAKLSYKACHNNDYSIFLNKQSNRLF